MVYLIFKTNVQVERMEFLIVTWKPGCNARSFSINGRTKNKTPVLSATLQEKCTVHPCVLSEIIESNLIVKSPDADL